MLRVALFVDGSNLHGTMRNLGIEITEHQALFRLIFQETARHLGEFILPAPPPIQFSRAYWYVVGSMDQWNFEDERARKHLRERFEREGEIRDYWRGVAAKKSPTNIEETAWALCLEDLRAWYEGKAALLDGMRKFHFAFESASSFVEICRVGRWKVDLLWKVLNEKGIDTSVAVDMVGLVDTYDVAVVITGDADGIPSIQYIKRRGKQVGVVEFVADTALPRGAKTFANQLKQATDFVIQIGIGSLLEKSVARRPSESATN